MADSLTASVLVKIAGTLSNTIQGTAAGIAFDSTTIAPAISFTDGTTSGKCDVIWFDEGRTLTGTTPEDIDLYDLGSIDIGAGSGKGPLGATLANAEITAILIQNRSTSTGNIFVGGKNATTAWNAIFAIGGVADDTAQIGPLLPGSFVCLGCTSDPAWAVADTTSHLLTMTPTANATYDIYVLARSA